MLIFLDFDGVLHPTFRDASRRVEKFCRREYLHQILQALPYAKVVFSTSWKDDYSLEQLTAFVITDSKIDPARFIGCTPTVETRFIASSPRPRVRQMEIEAYLMHIGWQGRWLALDDRQNLFAPDCPNLYLTNWEVGLTQQDVALIVALAVNGRR